MDDFEKQMKETGAQIDKSWEASGSLRAMRMVLGEKEGGKEALKEMDDFDMMSMMMGGGGGGGGPPGGAPKKKKKKKKKAKEEL